MTTIKIQFTLFSAFYSPLISTMSGGFLQEEGLDYEWSVSPPGKSAIEAVVSIRPQEAPEILIDLIASEDEDIAEAASEAMAMIEAVFDDEYEDDESLH